MQHVFRASAEDARDCLSSFAELVKSPEHIHTYRVTPLSLWNAAAAGLGHKEVVAELERFSKYEIPQNVIVEIEDQMGRYGRLKLYRTEDGGLVIESDDMLLIAELQSHRSIQPFIQRTEAGKRLYVKPEDRGNIKCALIKVGFPVEDLAGYTDGAPLYVELREQSVSGKPFGLRKYQRESVDAFWAGGKNHGGCGVVVGHKGRTGLQRRPAHGRCHAGEGGDEGGGGREHVADRRGGADGPYRRDGQA